MKRKTALLVLLISATTASLCFAGDNPLMGTWKLNESKSKIPANTPHNNTVVYAQSGDEVTITGDGVDAAGKAVHQVWTGKFDGKDYPAKGDVNQDMRAYKKVNANTVTYTVKRDGKTVGHGKVVVAEDGKSRKTSQTMTLANGKTVSQTAVFDKQ
jgi:uncharacterized lipoprotein YddW (UPF0748 family)